MNESMISTGRNGLGRKSRQISIVINQNDHEKERLIAPQSIAVPKQKHLHHQYDEMVSELHQLIGMDHVKSLVYEIYALLKIKKYREEAGLHSEQQVFHMVFKGNPGTGKTTVARILAKMLHRMGLLGKGHFIEAERADLVGEYIGHTALKTRELVKKALDGVLFIDEAYSLARGGEKDFGKEAIDALVKSMEDHNNQFVLILAGYPAEMDEFMTLNPGLPSRFPIQIEFLDYTVDQLLKISEVMLGERQYKLHPQAQMKLKKMLIDAKLDEGRSFSNARFVRNKIEKSIRKQAVRLLRDYDKQPGKQELMTLQAEDL